MGMGKALQGSQLCQKYKTSQKISIKIVLVHLETFYSIKANLSTFRIEQRQFVFLQAFTIS